MARSSSQIIQSIQNVLVSLASSIGITIMPSNWSKSDYKALTINAIGDGSSILEQNFDAFTQNSEDTISSRPPQTGNWLQNQMLNVFQYNLTDPQYPVVEAPDFIVKFPAVNPNYQIIKYCSVQKGYFGSTLIKVAASTNNLPSDLGAIDSGAALAAAVSFANTICAPGLSYVVTSGAADRIFMQLNVWFKGVYSGVIKTNITNAINSYLGNIPFDGIFKLSALESAILSVAGVTDVTFDNVQCRANATSFGSGTNIVLNGTEVNRNYSMSAGYMILEDTTGKTLSDYRVGSSGILNLNLISE